MKRDGLTSDRKTLEEIRLIEADRVCEGEPAATAIKADGFSRTTIYKWLNAASRPGLGTRALGLRNGTGRTRTLMPRLELQVVKWVNGCDPQQCGLGFDLWTRAIVVELIEKNFGIVLNHNIRTEGERP